MSTASLYSHTLKVTLAGQAKVFNYSDDDDFVTLWATADGQPAILADRDDRERALVIVWDGELPTSGAGPSDSLLVKHLTPLDWAVAFFSRVLTSDDLSARVRCQVVIVDLTSERDTEAWSSRMRNQILADLPWISLCAPLPAIKDAGALSWHQLYRPIIDLSAERSQNSAAGPLQQVTPHGSPLLVKAGTGQWQMCENLAHAGPSRDLDQAASRRLKAMSSQWLASLALSDDHHDINNVVGARVLISALGVQFGVVSDELFAPVVLTQADGTDVALGINGSRAVIAYLRDIGQIDVKGRIEHGLVGSLRDSTIPLSAEFEPVRAELAALLQNVATKSRIADAFLSRLAWCDQLPSVSEHHMMQVRNAASTLTAAGGGNIDVLLVDDMLNDGWGDVVASLIGVAAGCRSIETLEVLAPGGLANLGSTSNIDNCLNLFGSDSLRILVDRLSSASFHKRDFSSRILPKKVSHRGAEVLLLDLRLYVTQSRTAFHKVIRELWQKIRQKVTSRESELAWPSLASDAPVIDRWTNDPSSPEVPIEILTLVPRALALAYPILPILLFSSTGRAEIKEKLKPYRNIFTGFEKPRVLSSPDAIERSIAALANGFSEASRLVRAATTLRQLVEYAKSRQVYLPAFRTKNPPRYVEVFMDERGGEEAGITWAGKDLRSVATVLMFESEGSADGFQKQIEIEVARARKDTRVLSPSWVHWGHQPSNRLEKVDKVIGATHQEKKLNILARLEDGVNALEPLFALHRVSCFSVGIEQLALPLGPRRCDAIYDRMMRLNVEFIAHVLLPLFGVSKFKWRLYLPQRQVDAEDHTHAKDLIKWWGLDCSPYIRKTTKTTAWAVKTYPAGSYYPFIRELAHRWQGGDSELISGRGLALNYFETYTCASPDEVSELWPRWIAGLADWVANASKFKDRRGVLNRIVNDIGLTQSATGHSPEALELAIEALRNSTIPSGSTIQMVEYFFASWEKFLGPSRKVPRSEESRIAHAIYTSLLARLQLARGGDLVSAATKLEVPEMRATVAQFFGKARVEDVYPRDIDEPFGQYVVVRLDDEQETRVVLGISSDEPELANGAVLEVQLREPNGMIALDDDSRVNFYSVVSPEPKQLRRGAAELLESLERTEESVSVASEVAMAPLSPEQVQSIDTAVVATGESREGVESLELTRGLASATNAIATVAAGADQRQLGEIAAESLVEVAVVRFVGQWAVVQDANGIQIAIRRPRDEPKPGERLQCRLMGKRAEVEVGRPMLPFAVVV